MHLPPKCLDQLKCSICNGLLSIFPIYTMKNNDNQLISICGRCQVPDDRKYLRNEIYETLAHVLLYPCTNKEYGCMDELLPKDMVQHELTCRYRPQSCIFDKANNCQWKRSFNELLDHCKTDHANLILENYEFQMNMNENYDVLNVLQYDDELFLFKYSFDQNLKHLKCSITPVCFTEEQNTYYAQINLTIDGATMSRRFPEIASDPNQQQSIDMNINNMLNENNPIVMVTIKINTNQQQLNLNFNGNINEIFSKSKCSSCNGILYPPIYQCREGHYACNNCRCKSCTECSKKSCECRCDDCYDTYITKCTSCSERTNNSFNTKVLSPISDAMNFIYYPCQHGCKFLGNPSDLKHHLDHCSYKPYNCLLNGYVDCKWRDSLRNIHDHIFNDHKEHIINVNENVSLMINKQLVKHYKFLKFSGNLFKLIVEYRKSYLIWVVEVIDSNKNRNFKFEITISNDDNDKRIIMREYCGKVRLNYEYDMMKDACIYLHHNQILDYLVKGVLEFKINIMK